MNKQVETIRAEIGRRKTTAETMRERVAYIGLLNYLDTLPDEQPVEGLEEEYKDYVENDPVYSKLVNRIAGLGIARHFAEWGAEHGKK